MALYEVTRQLQAEQDQKFPDLTTSLQGIIPELPTIKNYNPAIAFGLESIPIQPQPASYERRLGPFYDPTISQENFLAQQQSGMQRIAYMIPRIAAKTISEVAQMPGYLGGAIAWGLNGFRQEDIGMMVNNWWQEGIKNIEEDVKDRLPVYTSDLIKSGNIWDNIFSTAFWANEGAEGAGFLLAFLAPGAALRVTGTGAKLAKLIKPGTTFLKNLPKAATAEEMAAGLAGTRLAGNVNDVISTIVNTLFESSAEAGQSFQAVLDKTGDREKAAVAAVDVLTKNFGILALSNYVDQKWLFGNSKLIRGYAEKGIVGALPKSNKFSRVLGELGKPLDAMAERTAWGNLGQLSKLVTKGFLKEGFYEEGMQFTVSKRAEEGIENDEGFISELVDIAKTYADSLTDIEFQKSVLLGGLLGSVMSGVSTVRDIRSEDRLLGNFHRLIKNNDINWATGYSDLIMKDEAGEPIPGENGEYQLDVSKGREFIAQKLNSYITNKNLIQLAKDNNVEGFELLRNHKIFEQYLPFAQVEGGLDAWYHYVNNLADVDIAQMKKEGIATRDLNTIKQELRDKGTRFQQMFDRINDTHDMNMNVKYAKEETAVFNEYSDRVRQGKIQNELDLQYTGERINALRSELTSFKMSNSNIASITSGETRFTSKIVDDLNSSLEEYRADMTDTDITNVEGLIKNIEGHIQVATVARADLANSYNKKFLQKDFAAWKTYKNESATTATGSAVDVEKSRESVGLPENLRDLYNQAVKFEQVGDDVIRHSGEVSMSFTDETGKLVTLTAEVLRKNAENNLDVKVLNEEFMDETGKLVSIVPVNGLGSINADNTITYNGVTHVVKPEDIGVTKPPRTTQYTPDEVSSVSTIPEDELGNIHDDARTYMLSKDPEAKHPFSIEKGVNNWLVSQGNQDFVTGNDDLGRWYLFVNKLANTRTKAGDHKYILKSFTLKQVGSLPADDFVRQNLRFYAGNNNYRSYDQLEDKDNIDANNDIRIVVFDKETNTTLRVSKNGEVNTDDKTQLMYSSLPLPKVDTPGMKERFSTRKIEVSYLTKLGVVAGQATNVQRERARVWAEGEVEKTRVEYETFRRSIEKGSVPFLISSINPGVKQYMGAASLDVMEGTHISNINLLAKKIHYVAIKPDAYKWNSSITVSGTEQVAKNGTWSVTDVDNRYEPIQPKTLGETGSADLITELLQTYAKDPKGNAPLDQYLKNILYMGFKDSKGNPSPWRLFFEYNRDVNNKPIPTSLSKLVFGDDEMSIEDFVAGKDIERIKTFLATKYWNFNNKLLNVKSFTEYTGVRDGVLQKRTWDAKKGGYVGFLFSPENNATKGTVFVRPQEKQGLIGVYPVNTNYLNQSVNLMQAGVRIEKTTPKNNKATEVLKKRTYAEAIAEPIAVAKPVTEIKPGRRRFGEIPEVKAQVEVIKQTNATEDEFTQDLTVAPLTTPTNILSYEDFLGSDDSMVKDIRESIPDPKNAYAVYKKTGITTAIEKPVVSPIIFSESTSSRYSDRTIRNASADATIAIAADFSSAGERLTKKSVLEQKKKYIGVDILQGKKVNQRLIDLVVRQLNEVNAKSLNIAGNGIYTLKGYMTQEEVDQFTYDLIKGVINSPDLITRIESIRTGGQTGFDEAGAKAGVGLGIPTTVLAPKGWIFRDITGKDISNEQAFKARFVIQPPTVVSNLDRLVTITDNYERENLEAAKAWLKEKFPEIPVEVIDGLIDNKSWGRLTRDATILLSSIAAVGTAYHEGFHTFSQLVLADASRKELYDEVRERLKNEELTDRQAEEILSEEFRSYMLSPNAHSFAKNEQSKKSFFGRLLDLILKIFHITKTGAKDFQIELTFDILKNGSFGVAARELPNELDRNRVEGLTPKETKIFVEDLNVEFFGMLFDPEATYTETALFNLDSSLAEIYNAIKFIYKYKTNKSELDQKILDNFDGVVVEHTRFLRQYQIDIRRVTSLEEIDVPEDEVDDKASSTNKDYLQIDMSELIKDPVRLLIAGLPSVVRDNRVGGTLTKYEGRSTVRFIKTMRYLMNSLTGLGNDFANYADRLADLSARRPEIKILIDRLSVDKTVLTSNQMLLQNQFVNAFSHNKGRPLLQRYGLEGKKYFFSPVEDRNNVMLRRQWLNNARNIARQEGSFIIRSGAKGRGKFILDTVLVQSAIVESQKLQKDSVERLRAYVDILNSLGIVLSDNPDNVHKYDIIDKYITYLSQEIVSRKPSLQEYKWARYSANNYEVSSTGDKRFSALYAKLADGRTIEEAYQLDVKGYRAKGNNWRLGKGKPPIRNISKEQQWNEYKNLWKKYLDENPGLLEDLAIKASGKTLTDRFASSDISQARALSEILNEKKGIISKGKELFIQDLYNADVIQNQKEVEALMEYAKEFFSNDDDLSYYNQDGNREHSINLNSHATNVVNTLNRITIDPISGEEVIPPEAESILPWDGKVGNLFARHSIYLPHRRAGGKLDLVLLKGLTTPNAKQGSEIARAYYGDYKSLEFNALLSGISPLLRTADRKTEYALDPGKPNYNIDRGDYKTAMFGYLQDELATSFALLIDPDNFGGDLANYSENAKELRVFNFLYSTELNAGDDVGPSSLEEFAKTLDPGDARDTVTKADDLVEQYITNHRDYIDRSFDRQIDRDMSFIQQELEVDEMIKPKYNIDKTKILGYETKGIDRDVIVDEDKFNITRNSYDNSISQKNLDRVILFASYMQFVGANEQLRLIFGDIAFWESPIDFHKRTTGATSTKQTLSDGEVLRSNMDVLFPRLDEKKRGSSASVVVVDDVISKNEDLLDISAKYGEIKGTDAASMNTLDGHRDIMIRHGVWPPHYEMTYQYEMQNFMLRMLSLKKTRSDLPFMDKISKEMFTSETGIFHKHTGRVMPIVPMYEGKEIKVADLGIITIQKPQGFGSITGIPGLNAMQYFKTASAPIFPSSIADDNPMLPVLLSMMENQQDILAFRSSQKGTVAGEQPLFDKKGNIPEGGYVGQEMGYKDFGLQLDIAEEGKKEVTASTQQQRLLFENIYDRGQLVKAAELGVLHNEDMQIINDIIEMKREYIINMLGLVKGENEVYGLGDKNSINKFRDELIAAFEHRLMPDNILDGIDIALESNEKVFDMIPSKFKIEEVLMAEIRNKVISRKTAGDMLIQEPDILYDAGLKFYRIDPKTKAILPMQVMVSLPYSLIDFTESIGGIDVLNRAIATSDTKVLGRDFFEILNVPMNRIPGQNLSSLDIVEVVRFHPHYHGAKVTLPPEITVKANSDFDVDKMTSYLNNFRIDPDTKKVAYFTDIATLEGKQNRLNGITREALLHPGRFEELVNPLSADHIQKLAMRARKKTFDRKIPVEREIINIANKSDKGDYDWVSTTSWWYNMRKGRDFFKSKMSMAMANIHNVATAISQVHPIKMRSYVPLFFEGQRFVKDDGSLDQNQEYNHGFVEDLDGYSVTKNSAGFVSAFIDAVKTPGVFELTDENTYNIIAFLNNRGKGDKSVGLDSITSLITQDSVIDYLRIVQANQPRYLIHNEFSSKRLNFPKQYAQAVSDLRIRLNGTDNDVPKMYLQTVTASLEKLLKIDKLLPDPGSPRYDTEKASLDRQVDRVLKEIRDKIERYQYKDFTKKELDSDDIRTSYRDQIQILDNFLMYKALASEQVGLNMLLRPDARSSMYRHIAAVQSSAWIPYETALKKGLFNREDIGDAILGKEGGNKSLIREYYNTKDMTGRMLGFTSMIHKDPVIQEFFEDNVYKVFGSPGRWMKKTDLDRVYTEVESDFLIFLMADKYGFKDYTQLQEQFGELFTGDNSIPRRLLGLQGQVRGNMAIEELQPDIANYVRRTRTLAETDNITTYNHALEPYTVDAIAGDLYSFATETTDDNRDFGADLVMHSIFQSGFTSAINSYIHVIPPKLFADIIGSKGDINDNPISRFLAMSDEAKKVKLESFMKQMYRNNANNQKMIPRSQFRIGNPMYYTDNSDFYHAYDYISFNHFTASPASYIKNKQTPPQEVLLYERVPGTKQFKRVTKLGDWNRFKEFYPMLDAAQLDKISIIESNLYKRQPLDVTYEEAKLEYGDSTDENSSTSDAQIDEMSYSALEDDIEDTPPGEAEEFGEEEEEATKSFDSVMMEKGYLETMGENETNSYYKILGKTSTIQAALRKVESKTSDVSIAELARVLRLALNDRILPAGTGTREIPLEINRVMETESEEAVRYYKNHGIPKRYGMYYYSFYPSEGKIIEDRIDIYEKVNDKGFEVTAIHEAMHALSQNKYMTDPAFKAKLDGLRDYTSDFLSKTKNAEVRRYLEENSHLFSDPTEFLSHGLSKTSFQELLARVPAKNPELVEGKLTQRSVLHEFIDSLFTLVRDFFHKKYGTADPDYNDRIQRLTSVLHELVLLVQEDLLTKPVAEEPVVREVPEEELIESRTKDQIKDKNITELGKEESKAFDDLYEDYDYLSDLEQEAFEDAVNKGMIELSCGI